MTVTYKTLDFLIRGASVLSTGGGGTMSNANTFRDAHLDRDHRWKLIQPNDLDGVAITIFGIGSLGIEMDVVRPMHLAYEALISRYNINVKGLLPVEIGPECVIEPFLFAQEFNIPVVDTDLVGMRSAPEVFLESITLFDVNRTPAVAASLKGDVIFLEGELSAIEIEDRLRTFAAQNDGLIYMAGVPMDKEQIKLTTAVGGMSRSIELGKMIENKDWRNFVETLSAKTLFIGTVSSVQREDIDGFLTGEITITNEQSDTLTVLFKNENIVAKKEKDILLTVPDLISIISKDTWLGYSNADINEGDAVYVLGIPAHPLWRTQEGVELFSPNVIGFDVERVLL